MQIIDQPQLPRFSADTFVAEIDGSKTRTLRSFYTRIAKFSFSPIILAN